MGTSAAEKISQANKEEKAKKVAHRNSVRLPKIELDFQKIRSMPIRDFDKEGERRKLQNALDDMSQDERECRSYILTNFPEERAKLNDHSLVAETVQEIMRTKC